MRYTSVVGPLVLALSILAGVPLISPGAEAPIDSAPAVRLETVAIPATSANPAAAAPTAGISEAKPPTAPAPALSAEISTLTSSPQIASGEQSINTQQSSTHPRLFFTGSDLPSLRERMGRSPYSEMAQSILRQSDSLLRRPLLQMAYDPRQGRPPERINLLPAGAARARIASLAFSYVLSGEQRYADRATEEMLNIASWPAWADFNLNGMEADLSTGDISFGMALGYDWLYETLTGEQRAEVRDAIISKGLRAYLRGIADPRKHFWVNAYHNWNAVVNGSIGVAALALVGEEPAAEEALAQARGNIGRFFASVGADGGWDEGVGYWQYGMDHAVPYLMALVNVKGTDDGHFSRPGMRQTGYFPIYFTIPSGERTVSFSDNASKGPVKSPALYALASRYRDPAFVWYADSHKVSDPLGYIWRPDDLSAIEPSSLVQSKLFRDIGWATMRNRWDDPADTVYVAAKSGRLGANHSHLDLNDFVVYAYGELLVSNAGTAPYSYKTFSKERNSIYGISTRGHNSILVNEEGQAPRSRGSLAQPSQNHLIGDASEAYRDLKRFRRHLFFVDGRYLILLDDIVADKPARLSWLLHTEAALRVTGRDFTIEGEKARLYGFVSGSQDFGIEVRQGPEARRWAEQPDRFLSATTRSSVEDAVFVAVLYPTRLSEAGPVVSWRQQSDTLVVQVLSSTGIADSVTFRKTPDGWDLG
ncbi:MAG: heparinase II/III family protein [Chloroflexi bacterium]|nr:heparinase II/III family protein [Chloroflexota bacterium]